MGQPNPAMHNLLFNSELKKQILEAGRIAQEERDAAIPYNYLSWLLFLASSVMLCVAFPPVGLSSVAVNLLGLLFGFSMTYILPKMASAGAFDEYKTAILIGTGMLFAVALSFLVVPAMPAMLTGLMAAAVWKGLAALSFALFVPAVAYMHHMMVNRQPEDSRLWFMVRMAGLSIFLVAPFMFTFPGHMLTAATSLHWTAPVAAQPSLLMQGVAIGAGAMAAILTVTAPLTATLFSWCTRSHKEDPPVVDGGKNKGAEPAPLTVIDKPGTTTVVNDPDGGLTPAQPTVQDGADFDSELLPDPLTA